MKTKTRIIAILVSIISTGTVFSQENTTATGGEATGSGGTVSYSVGQVAFTSQTGTNGSINQGVQQPLIIETNSLFESEIDFSVLLFPNPTVAEIHVELKEVSLENLNYILTDAKGKQIQTQVVSSDEITINLADYSRGNYYLNFVQKGKVVGAYTVIKN